MRNPVHYSINLAFQIEHFDSR